MRLTPWAPPTVTRGPSRQRWGQITCYGATARQALARLLERLERDAAEVEVRAMMLGDTAVLSARAGEPKVPLAFIDEVEPDEVLQAQADLLARSQA